MKTAAQSLTSKSIFSFSGFSYKYFNFLGRLFSRVFYSNSYVKLDEALSDAGLRIYPEAYYSMIGLVFLITVVLTIPLVVFTQILLLIPLPLIMILLGYAIPKTMASDRAQKLDLEVPFAGTYVSVMATGGLSPYASLKRLKGCDLLPKRSAPG